MPEKNVIRTADICDAHPEASLIQINFNDYGKRQYFHGVAVTYTTYEDISGIREILSKEGQGKVLVVDGRGSMRRALCGGNIATQAYESGWEGLIFNGAIRDQHEIALLDFGLKAIGSSPMRPSQNGPGMITQEAFIGNVIVRSGEYIYADADGVVVLPEQVQM